MDLPAVGREGALSGLSWLRIVTAGELHFNRSRTTVCTLQHKWNSIAHIILTTLIQSLNFQKVSSKFYT